MDPFLYTGAKTNQISFPLGGIGTGCIGLGGNGRLMDWEIFNRPNKGSVNGFSHFAVRVERVHADREAEVIDARILNGDLAAPYMGEAHATRFGAYGWGPRREYLTGVPHFRSVEFLGKFPLAELAYHEENFPGQIRLSAFNPLIPLNEDDSSIPAAFFEFTITNSTDEALTYALAGVLANPQPAQQLHTATEQDGLTLLHLRSSSNLPGDPATGDLTLATDAQEVSWQEYWYRGRWFDSLEVYWKDLSSPGAFRNRTYPPEKAGEDNHGLLAAHLHLEPGQSQSVRFVISWNFPNCINYWKPVQDASIELMDAWEPEVDAPRPEHGWRNWYATRWADSRASATYALQEWQRLAGETRRFQESLFASTLPAPALDAISANLAILKSPTVLRLEDGSFYGWEGCHPSEGCCEGSCTHVWNYQQALPFLFPRLERSMREADYQYNLQDDGGMPFRLQLPLGRTAWNFRPCCDGQFGGVMKTYREWKISGDSEWLSRIWPGVKASLEYAWSPHNPDRWDPEQTGVLWGRQHHTLDMELFGPNSWLTGFYLGALKAGAEMAEHLGEMESAQRYRSIFARGKAWADQHLFNGEFYGQQIDLGDRTILEQFMQGGGSLHGDSILDAYWNEEHGEIKYQLGEGSSIDQLLAQWHADLYGLGEIFDPEQVQKALQALYKYNFKASMREEVNPCRIYCLNDEGGLVICAWPPEAHKPVIPAPYSQETMNGFEYSAATHMILRGLVDEGMTAVAAVRERYDGEKRNPWNEFECGSNYARSMASYALLNVYSGFHFDMVQGEMGFDPVRTQDGYFRTFWSLGQAWGEYEQSGQGAKIRVLGGTLTIQRVGLPTALRGQAVQVTLDGQEINTHVEGEILCLADSVRIGDGKTLHVNKNRVPGGAMGMIQIASDFDAPLPDELLADFSGDDAAP